MNLIDKLVSFWNNTFKGVMNMKSKISLSSKAPSIKEESLLEEAASEETVTALPVNAIAPKTYTHQALSMYRNKYDEWVLVGLKFDPKTKEVSQEIEEISIVSDKEICFERFRVEVINRGIA